MPLCVLGLLIVQGTIGGYWEPARLPYNQQDFTYPHDGQCAGGSALNRQPCSSFEYKVVTMPYPAAMVTDAMAVSCPTMLTTPASVAHRSCS